MRSRAVSFVASFGREMNSSQIGRYTMMVKQAADLSEFRNIMVESIQSEKSKKFIKSIIEKSEVSHYRDNHWREYLLLILTLIKYQNREEKSNEQN